MNVYKHIYGLKRSLFRGTSSFLICLLVFNSLSFAGDAASSITNSDTLAPRSGFDRGLGEPVELFRDNADLIYISRVILKVIKDYPESIDKKALTAVIHEHLAEIPDYRKRFKDLEWEDIIEEMAEEDQEGTGKIYSFLVPYHMPGSPDPYYLKFFIDPGANGLDEWTFLVLTPGAAFPVAISTTDDKVALFYSGNKLEDMTKKEIDEIIGITSTFEKKQMILDIDQRMLEADGFSNVSPVLRYAMIQLLRFGYVKRKLLWRLRSIPGKEIEAVIDMQERNRGTYVKRGRMGLDSLDRRREDRERKISKFSETAAALFGGMITAGSFDGFCYTMQSSGVPKLPGVKTVMLVDNAKIGKTLVGFGTESIAAFLRLFGVDVEIVDRADLVSGNMTNASFTPDIIWTAIDGEDADESTEMFDLLRAQYPDSLLLAGGDITGQTEDIFDVCSSLDGITGGWAEFGLLDTVMGIDPVESDKDKALESFKRSDGAITRESSGEKRKYIQMDFRVVQNSIDPDIAVTFRDEEPGLDDRAEKAGLLNHNLIRHDMAVKNRVNPDNRDLNVLYGAAGADVSNCFLSTNASTAFFTSGYHGLDEGDLRRCFGGEEGASRYIDKNLNAKYRGKYDSGFSNSMAIDGKKQMVAAVAFELRAIGVDLAKVKVASYKTDSHTAYPMIEFDWRYSGDDAPKKRRVIFIDAYSDKPEQYKNALKGFELDIYYQRAGNELAKTYDHGEEGFMNYVYHRMRPGGYFITDDVYFSQDNSGENEFFRDNSSAFPFDLDPINDSRIEKIADEILRDRVRKEARKGIIDDRIDMAGYGWNVNIRQKPHEESALQEPLLDDLVKDKNFMFISFRLNKEALDGVSLEVEKWREVLEAAGANVHYYSGETTAEGSVQGHEFFPAHFRNNAMEAINKRIFRKRWFRRNNIDEEDDKAIERIKGKIKADLTEYVTRNGIEYFIAENIFAFPGNLALSEAVIEVAEELKIKVIAHSHDFWWERDRFKNNIHPELAKRLDSFSVRLERLGTLVINSGQAKTLLEKKGLSDVEIAPNVMSFKDRPEPDPAKIIQFRKDFGIKDDEIFLLAPVRPVPRKDMHRGIDVAEKIHKKTGKTVKIMVTHLPGDEGMYYWESLKDHAQKTDGVILVPADRVYDLIHSPDPAKKKYELEDSYDACDMVLYTSSWEGWGNAFVEAMYFKKPVITYPYKVFREDIGPKHVDYLEVRTFYDKLCELKIIGWVFRSGKRFPGVRRFFCATERQIDNIVSMLNDPAEYERSVEYNYALGKKVFSYGKIKKLLYTMIQHIDEKDAALKDETGKERDREEPEEKVTVVTDDIVDAEFAEEAEKTTSPLAEYVRGKNIAFLSYRLKAAAMDGVSREALKWRTALQEEGANVYYYASDVKTNGDPLKQVDFLDSEMAKINERIFKKRWFPRPISVRDERVINKLKHRIKEDLIGYVEENNIEYFIAENILGYPGNLAFSEAVLEVAEEKQIKVIAHSHVYWWERPGYSHVHSSTKARLDALSTKAGNLVTVVVNENQAKVMAGKGLDTVLVSPNVMPPNGRPPVTEERTGAFRSDFGIGPEDILLLSSGRPVPRKDLNRTVDVAHKIYKRTGRHVHIMVPQQPGAEGIYYWGKVEKYAEEVEGVTLIPEEKTYELFHREGKVKYLLEDAYEAADMVISTSRWEEWGNNFVEAMKFRKPVITYPYKTFRTDIASKGVKCIELYTTLDLLCEVPFIGRVFEKLRSVGFISRYFAAEEHQIKNIAEMLESPDLQDAFGDHNYNVGQAFFSMDRLKETLCKVFKVFEGRDVYGGGPGEPGGRGVEGKKNPEYTPEIKKAIEERKILPVWVRGKDHMDVGFEKLPEFSYVTDKGTEVIKLEECEYSDRKLNALDAAFELMEASDLNILAKTCIVFFNGKRKGHYSLSYTQMGKAQMYINIKYIDNPRSLATILHHELQEWNHVITSMDMYYPDWRKRRRSGNKEIEEAIDYYAEEKHRELLGLPPLKGLKDPHDYADAVIDKVVETVGLPVYSRPKEKEAPTHTDTVLLGEIPGSAKDAVRTVFDIPDGEDLKGTLNITYRNGIAVYLYLRRKPGQEGINVVDLTGYYDHADVRELEELRKEVAKEVLTMDDHIKTPKQTYVYLILNENGAVRDIISEHPTVYAGKNETFASDMKQKGIPFRKIPIFPGIFDNLHLSSLISARATAKYARENMKVLIIGTGAGIEAKLASEIGAQVDAVDIKEMAARNTEFTCSLASAGKGGKLNAFQNDLFNGLGQYDLIVFNMPHMQEKKEKVSPGFSNTTDSGGRLLKRVAAELYKHLIPTGRAVLINSDGARLPGEGTVEDILNRGENIRVRQTGADEQYFGVPASEMSSSRAFIVERDDQGYLPPWSQRYPKKDKGHPAGKTMLSKYAPAGDQTLGIYSRSRIDYVIKEMKGERQWKKYKRNIKNLKGIAAPYECLKDYELYTPVYRRVLPYAVKQEKVKNLGEILEGFQGNRSGNSARDKQIRSILDQFIDTQLELLRRGMRDPVPFEILSNYGVDDKGKLMLIGVGGLDEASDITDPSDIFDQTKERLTAFIDKFVGYARDPGIREHFAGRLATDFTFEKYKAAWEESVQSKIDPIVKILIKKREIVITASNKKQFIYRLKEIEDEGLTDGHERIRAIIEIFEMDGDKEIPVGYAHAKNVHYPLEDERYTVMDYGFNDVLGLAPEEKRAAVLIYDEYRDKYKGIGRSAVSMLTQIGAIYGSERIDADDVRAKSQPFFEKLGFVPRVIDGQKNSRFKIFPLRGPEVKDRKITFPGISIDSVEESPLSSVDDGGGIVRAVDQRGRINLGRLFGILDTEKFQQSMKEVERKIIPESAMVALSRAVEDALVSRGMSQEEAFLAEEILDMHYVRSMSFSEIADVVNDDRERFGSVVERLAPGEESGAPVDIPWVHQVITGAKEILDEATNEYPDLVWAAVRWPHLFKPAREFLFAIKLPAVDGTKRVILCGEEKMMEVARFVVNNFSLDHQRLFFATSVERAKVLPDQRVQLSKGALNYAGVRDKAIIEEKTDAEGNTFLELRGETEESAEEEETGQEEMSFPELLDEGYRFGIEREYSEVFKAERMIVKVFEKDAVHDNGADIQILIAPGAYLPDSNYSGVLIIDQFYPHFPEEKKGRGRALLRYLIERPEFQGYAVIAKASEAFQRSFKKMREYDPIIDLENAEEISETRAGAIDEMENDPMIISHFVDNLLLYEELKENFRWTTLFGKVPMISGEGYGEYDEVAIWNPEENVLAQEKEKARELIRLLIKNAFNNKADGKIILAIDDSWMPKEFRTIEGFQLLLNTLEDLSERGEEGLKNVIIVKGRGTALAGKIKDKMDETGTSASNVVMLVKDSIMDNAEFNEFRSTSGERKASIIGVNPDELKESAKDTRSEKFIRLIEMLNISLTLGFADEKTDMDELIKGLFHKYNRVGIMWYPDKPRMFLLIPKAGPIDYAVESEKYEAQIAVITAA